MDSVAKTSLQNGKYLIKRVLGQSRLSTTLQGVHAQSNRLVVLKTLKREWQQQPEFPLIKQRFQEQIDRFAQCQHPGLVRIIDAFEEKGLLFVVMDYTPGQTLQELVAMNGPFPEDRAIHYIQQVGSALTESHQHGLVHRDITPKNIIRPSNADIVVLTNFGLTDRSALGLLSGKFSPLAGPYAAIEQYQTQFPITPATDVYALAATLYFLLTGHAPLSAPSRGESRLPSPRQYCPHLSATHETAILRGLELNPKKRPQTIVAWLSLLTQTENSTGAVASTSSAEQMLTNTYSKVNKKERPISPKRSHSRPESSPKGKTLNHPVNTLSAIAPSKHFQKVVLSTALLAASIGLSVALMLRLAASSTGPGASFFHSEQSFPVLENWPGVVDPVAPPSVYSSPRQSSTPASSAPVAPYQPDTPIPPSSAPELAPLPEQAAEKVVPLPTPAPETIQQPAANSPSNEVAPEPVPAAPVEPVAPSPVLEPPPPAPSSQGAPTEGPPTEAAPN